MAITVTTELRIEFSEGDGRPGVKARINLDNDVLCIEQDNDSVWVPLTEARAFVDALDQWLTSARP